ncbi:MAG: DUF2515 family protein [Bacillaceae bacterium]|nr:DUF2515 family protein [Bacillaceae bacterium]
MLQIAHRNLRNQHVFTQLKQLSKKPVPNPPTGHGFSDLKPWEQQLVNRIHQQTIACNLNNMTRTEAYYYFYQHYPEIHWAFLAHMVSRNSGWNMTDLKGEWLPYLLESHEIPAFFQFLEKGNWLIFQDAYPQLLLYAEGKRRKKNLSYLLPFFYVSRFMRPIWDDFLIRTDSVFLTRALIINEQNYIQKRLIENPYFVENVVHTMEYKARIFFNMNPILFPYNGRPGSQKNVQLAGMETGNFSSLDQRIRTGKSLYHLLFPRNRLNTKIFRWARDHPHTGSRADYWPEVFSRKKMEFRHIYQRKIFDCHLKKGQNKIYSPELLNVWKNRVHEAPDRTDWFHDTTMFKHLEKAEYRGDKTFTTSYCKLLKKLDWAAWAESRFKWFTGK